MSIHTPVLLKETINALSIVKGGKYVDATYGQGGHSKEIARRGGSVLGIELDSENVTRQKALLKELRKKDKDIINIKLVEGNYGNIKNIAKRHNFVPCEGIVFDLGLSMEQIRLSGRGFSYEKRSEPLDMRISADFKETAFDIVNSYSLQELYEIFSRNAEEINSRSIAEAIFVSRRIKKIETVGDLIDIIEKISKNVAVKARVFQALRVEVNEEYNNIKEGVKGAMSIIKKGGRIAIITFHPSEDRIVKKTIKDSNFKVMNTIKGNKKYIYERSAKLRIIENV